MGLIGVVFLVVAVITVTHLVGTNNAQTCSLAAPIPSLSPQLRAIGGFDQPYDPGDRQTIDTLAVQAASATSPGLAGALPGDAVSVSSVSPQRPDALVLPLLTDSGTGSLTRVVALVSFLRDCSGRVYFSSVDDLSAPNGASTLRTFPAVSAAVAAQRLGITSPQLAYTSNPFVPLWRDPASGSTVSAES